MQGASDSGITVFINPSFKTAPQPNFVSELYKGFRLAGIEAFWMAEGYQDTNSISMFIGRK
jgi:hypothetical protein